MTKIPKKHQLQPHLMVQENPEWFVQNILGNRLWKKQKEILNAVWKHKRVAIRSCHASGKTFTASNVVLTFLAAFPESAVITTAPTARQVEHVLWREIRGMVANSKYPLADKEPLKTKWELAENWFALGLSVNQPEAFQGFHNKHILFVVDEASGVADEIFEAIEGGLSGGTSKLLMIGNPTRNSGYFYEAFKQSNVKKIRISAFDTPNLEGPGHYIKGLVTKGWIKEVEGKYGKDSDFYRVRVLGDFPKSEADSFIGLDLVEKAVQNSALHGEKEYIGVDVARFGGDETVLMYRKGNYAKILEKIQKKDTMETVGRVVVHARDFPNARICVDSIGVGAGVVDRLMELSEVRDRTYGVNVALKAVDSENYLNSRAEAYWDLKEWLKDANLEPGEDWFQLTNMKYKFTSKGQLQMESKDDMKKRGIKSPDVADALMLTFCEDQFGQPDIFFV